MKRPTPKIILNAFLWTVLTAALFVPVAAASASPLLAWRDPVYVAAGLAGVVGLSLLLLQPLLAGGYLAGLRAHNGRRLHRIVGIALVCAVVVHVAGLWITSPPDVVDALTFTSPTPFANWGVIAMWAIFLSALLAMTRRRLRLRPAVWRLAHLGLAAVIVIGTVVHAVLIEGTMETISKVVLSALAIAATATIILDMGRRHFLKC